MERRTIHFKEQGATAKLSLFAENQVDEMHVILSLDPRSDAFTTQQKRLFDSVSLLLSSYPTFKIVLKRYFLSDATNQVPLLPKENDCAVSRIQQPPLNGTKIAVWMYLVQGVSVRKEGDFLVVEHNGYKHLYQADLYEISGDSYTQTKLILERYEKQLDTYHANLDENCIRTWFFIRDVDTQYKGMVRARRENFVKEGLTEKTHYIASTGIGGSPAHPSSLLQMDAYSVLGLQKLQYHHLYASTHLNSTYEYGVTFERGTIVEYGDRSHLFISGTASIDNKGNVLHVGDVVKQCERMWENVETLLKEGGATYDNVTQMIVYLRDMADYEVIRTMYEVRFPNHPVIFTLAPVCRPTWLIEMECQAITPNGNKKFISF